MDSFFSQHAVFLIPIAVSLLTQVIKFILFGAANGWKWQYIFTHGHMPSSHTALAISLLTSIGYYEGIGSGAFAVSAILAFLIVDDALRLRAYLGEQGKFINLLVKELRVDPAQFPRLKEHVGHKPEEVIAGAFVGFFLTILFIRLFS